MENKLFSLLFHRFTPRSIDTARPCETTPEIIGGPMENTRFSLVFHRFTEINKYNRRLVKHRNPSGLTGFVWRGFTVGILINRYLPAGQDRSLQGLQLSRPLPFLIGYVCVALCSNWNLLFVICFYSCDLLILLSSLKKWPSATSFLIWCVWSRVFSLGSTLVILFYSCHLLILLSSLEKWPSATSFLIGYVCSLVFSLESTLVICFRSCDLWFSCLRPFLF